MLQTELVCVYFSKLLFFMASFFSEISIFTLFHVFVMVAEQNVITKERYFFTLMFVSFSVCSFTSVSERAYSPPKKQQRPFSAVDIALLYTEILLILTYLKAFKTDPITGKYSIYS